MNMHITESSFDDKPTRQQNAAIIIGISINNSYFKEENIKNLIDWACCHSTSVYIMIPDDPMVHTLMAIGYTEADARKKVRLKTNALKNLCKRLIGSREVEIITWDKVIPNLQYQVGLGVIIKLYKENEQFRNATNQLTSEVIVSNGGVCNSDTLSHGVQFLIKELAFITHSGKILNQERTVYVYHKTMGLLKDLVSGKYPLDISQKIDFVTLI